MRLTQQQNSVRILETSGFKKIETQITDETFFSDSFINFLKPILRLRQLQKMASPSNIAPGQFKCNNCPRVGWICCKECERLYTFKMKQSKIECPACHSNLKSYITDLQNENAHDKCNTVSSRAFFECPQCSAKYCRCVAKSKFTPMMGLNGGGMNLHPPGHSVGNILFGNHPSGGIPHHITTLFSFGTLQLS